ncbi:MobF family relaxase [Nocardia sp. CDC153]|uniref:MobF family relaxase n=1 Tax=Nocardia sp. CDC153 TaxID=3112167 RepID=UPI002DB8F390|nr:MobF family relaxase [Nocardia sp. CDC153]MEC3952575.1 MobF family relaxase [Nocardia sp. CDC153]
MVLIISNIADPRSPCGGAEEPGHYGGALAASLDLLDRPVTRAEALTFFSQGHSGSRIAYEIVLSPPRSWSIIWGLGDSEVRQSLETSHAAALVYAMAYVEKELSYTRRGRNGIAQIDASLLWAQFDHFSDWHERPDRHAHVLISAQVLGSDGQWGQLDVRPLRRNAEAETFQAAFRSSLAQHTRRAVGLRLESRPPFEFGEEPRLEFEGVPDELIMKFFGESVSSWRESDWRVL